MFLRIYTRRKEWRKSISCHFFDTNIKKGRIFDRIYLFLVINLDPSTMHLRYKLRTNFYANAKKFDCGFGIMNFGKYLTGCGVWDMVLSDRLMVYRRGFFGADNVSHWQSFIAFFNSF